MAGGFFLGVVFIVLVAVIWTMATVLVQFIFDELDFREPFFLTFVSIALFSVYVPVWLVAVRVPGLRVRNPPWRYAGETLCPQSLTTPAAAAASPRPRSSRVSRLADDDARAALRQGGGGDGGGPAAVSATTPSATPAPPVRLLSHLALAKAAMVVCPSWFLANCAYSYSLSLTSNSSSTIISSTSSLFTFVLSVRFAGERFSWEKAAGVVFCMLGTSLVAANDHADDAGIGDRSASERVGGDLLALVSALMYGAYTTSIKVWCGDDDQVSMVPLFGYLGVFSVLVLTVPLLVLMSVGAVDLTNLSPMVFGALVGKGLADNVLSDYLWARACLLTSPTVATVGLSLTVPFAFLSDMVLHGKGVTGLEACGAALVVVGFVLVNGAYSAAAACWGRRRRRFGAQVSPAPPAQVPKGSKRVGSEDDLGALVQHQLPLAAVGGDEDDDDGRQRGGTDASEADSPLPGGEHKDVEGERADGDAVPLRRHEAGDSLSPPRV